MKTKWVGKLIGVAAVVCALGTPDAGAQTLVEGCHAVVVPAEGGSGARRAPGPGVEVSAGRGRRLHQGLRYRGARWRTSATG